MRPRALTLALAAGAVLAGCGGGGGDAVAFDDVKPCLDRLAFVTGGPIDREKLNPPEGVVLAKWSGELSYRTLSKGANVARLAGYGSEKDAQSELKRTHEAADRPLPQGQVLDENTRRMFRDAELVGDTVILTWSTPPAAKQKRRLKACFT